MTDKDISHAGFMIIWFHFIGLPEARRINRNSSRSSFDLSLVRNNMSIVRLDQVPIVVINSQCIRTACISNTDLLPIVSANLVLAK